jgi:peptidoglycan hydrolase-like protein with peptidoglycan-binding domain
MLLPIRDVQRFLKTLGLYAQDVDGIIGPGTNVAVAGYLAREGIQTIGWSDARKLVGVEQLIFKAAGIDVGVIDGFIGPQTQQAFDDYVKADRDRVLADEVISHQMPTWPRQADVPVFYGEKGQNQTMLPLPYPMKVAWNSSQIINRMSLHQKCAPSAGRVLQKVLEIYGSRISELGLDLWGGSLNVRLMRGGTKWSMHSWGIAIDFDPEHNDLHTPFAKARFGAPAYVPWWEAWEAEGWISLGRSRNYDTMHVQAARL